MENNPDEERNGNERIFLDQEQKLSEIVSANLISSDTTPSPLDDERWSALQKELPPNVVFRVFDVGSDLFQFQMSLP